MKTIELNISKKEKPRQILKLFKEKKFSRGDRLRIRKKDEEVSLEAVMGLILILVIWYFVNERGEKKSQYGEVMEKKTFGAEVEDMMFDKTISPEVLEKQIEKEYGVLVEINNAPEDNERLDWLELSKRGLAKAYSEDEPEYSIADVKEPNPLYKTWKKGK